MAAQLLPSIAWLRAGAAVEVLWPEDGQYYPATVGDIIQVHQGIDPAAGGQAVEVHYAADSEWEAYTETLLLHQDVGRIRLPAASSQGFQGSLAGGPPDFASGPHIRPESDFRGDPDPVAVVPGPGGGAGSSLSQEELEAAVVAEAVGAKRIDPRTGEDRRWRDCHFAGTPSPSLLEYLLKREGSAAE